MPRSVGKPLVPRRILPRPTERYRVKRKLKYHSKSQQLTTTDAPSKMTFWILVATLIWCAIPLSPNTVDSDFWGHVQYGQDTLDYGLSYISTYTFTAEGYRWINHENLSEVVFGWIVRHLGTSFVLILKCLCGCLVIGLMMQNALKKRVGAPTIALTAILVSINLSFYWGVRPQFFSFTFFAILLAFDEKRLQPDQLAEITRRESIARFLFVFAIFVIWTNTHGGFVAGVAVFCVLMAGRAGICLMPKSRNIRLAGTYFACSMIALGATLINPYGIQLHGWLFESLRIPRPEIVEWHAPELLDWSSLKLWAVILLSFLSILLSRLKKDAVQITVFSLVLLQTLSHQRHLPFLCILFGFWIPRHLQDCLSRVFEMPNRQFSPQAGSVLSRLAIGFLMVISCSYAIQVAHRLKPITVSTERYPVDAVNFMHKNNLTGSIVASGEWAQYLIGVAGARTSEDRGLRVAFDGRFRTCYPQIVVDMHFDFFSQEAGLANRYRSEASKELNPTKVLSYEQPQFVLVKESEYRSIQTLRANSDDWICLYRDGVAQLWGKTELYDDPSSAEYIREEDRFQTELAVRAVRWPAAPQSSVFTRRVSISND